MLKLGLPLSRGNLGLVCELLVPRKVRTNADHLVDKVVTMSSVSLQCKHPALYVDNNGRSSLRNDGLSVNHSLL